MVRPQRRLGDLRRRAIVPVLAVASALILGAVVIVLTDFEHLRDIGSDPLGAVGGAVGGMLRGYGALLSGAVVDPGRVAAALQSGDARDLAAAIRPTTESLVSATPYIFCGLALAIAFHAGLFNLGADGQFLIGGLGATIAAILLGGRLSPGILLVAALVAGTLAGAAYGLVPGLLKARTGAHEVITTLMFNSLAPEITILALGLPALDGSPGLVAQVPRVFHLPAIRLDLGFVVALLMAAVVSALLFRTTTGLELRAAGFSRTAARSAGMRPGRGLVLAMTLSGGLAGMAGSFVTLGPAGVLSSSGGIGLFALAIALIAGLRPGGVVLVALLVGALHSGARNMVIVSGVPLDLLVVIIAVALALVAAPGLVRSLWRLPAGAPDQPAERSR